MQVFPDEENTNKRLIERRQGFVARKNKVSDTNSNKCYLCNQINNLDNLKECLNCSKKFCKKCMNNMKCGICNPDTRVRYCCKLF